MGHNGSAGKHTTQNQETRVWIPALSFATCVLAQEPITYKLLSLSFFTWRMGSIILFFSLKFWKKKKKGFVTDRVSLPLSTALAPRRYSVMDVSSIEVECAMSTG